MSDNPSEGNRITGLTNGPESYVNSIEFGLACAEKARELPLQLATDYGGFFDDLWSDSDSASIPPTDVIESPHDPCKLEAHSYYSGISPRSHCPRLVYRDSDDVFEEPGGPDNRVREMKLVHVPETHEFAHNGLWEKVRDWVADFLIAKGVCVSSVDFVRFHWLKERDWLKERVDPSDDEEWDAIAEREGANEDEKEDEEGTNDDTDLESLDSEALDAAYSSIPLPKPVKDGEDYYSNATIWVGVIPDTLTDTVAHELAKVIRSYLDELQLQKRVDIAFRESIARPLAAHGPELYAPIEDGDPLQEFIDDVSVALSLPIVGLKTPMQGTMGPFFHHRGKLYGITARHNLFLANDGNQVYRYNTHLESAAKKRVCLMSNRAFINYKSSVQACIHNLGEDVKTLNIQIAALADRVANGIGLPDTRDWLEGSRYKLKKIERKIVALKEFFITLSRKWSHSDRIIGHVVYAPPIVRGVGPNRFTQDFCIVQLDKAKFGKFLGNILSLGPEYRREDRVALMNKHTDVKSDFEYPTDGLITLKGILTADNINNPNILDTMGDHVRRVIKRGSKTKTTVGTLNRFLSFEGDSGSVIVSPGGEFVGLLTGGTNKGTDGTDITYATLFEHIWELVQEQFPGADLYWEDIPAFLAGVAAAA